MYLNTIQTNVANCCRVLIVTEERTMPEDLRISHALQSNSHHGGSSAEAATARLGKAGNAVPPQMVCAMNDKEALALVEAAQREHRPFSVVIIDGRLFHGKDHRQIVRRLWQVQKDLHVVLHAVSQLEAFEQIPIDLGSSHQLLVLKFRLVPFEITQIVRTLTAKYAAEHQTAHRSLNLNAQLLEMTTRFEDASNRLRLEQDHRKQLEDKLCRNQRLETAGRFADAMAHFFKNYLTVIQGHLEVALSARQKGADQTSVLEELLAATRRTAGVTSQFVTFNTREYLQAAPLNLRQIIDDQAALLQKALGEQIKVHINHHPALPCVMADQASLEQIVFNLLMHARDSMPSGGRLMIETRLFSVLDEASACQTHPDARPGHFAAMVLSDTGKGMTPEEMTRLFDASRPASAHDGADISLILVQGMVRLQGGWIGVNSVPGVGTEFTIYLPLADGVTPAPSTPEKKLLDTSSSEESSTILVVDDEDSVRQVMEYVLASQGHKVLCAGDASEAWTLWRENSATIQLAIIDVKLPGGASGFDLEKAISDEDPTLPVIFTCGYSPTSLSNSRELKAGENFLPKPFGMVELLNIVGKALLRPARL